MTMHASLQADLAADDPVACLRELMGIALDLADELGVPGEIGAHLDHSLQLLCAFSGPART